jgi:FkbM family methyltransferase
MEEYNIVIKKLLRVPYIKFMNYVLTLKHDKKYECRKYLGKDYKVIRGTIRSTNDYDEAWLLFLCQEARIVFDIGCNIGQSTLLIASSKSLKKLVLVEPNPYSLSNAAENLILNNQSQNIIFIPKAAYNISGKIIQLWTMHGSFSGASTNIDFTKTGTISKNYIDVQTITLDDIAKTYDIYPDLVKIDVEGAENYVLEGASEIANKGGTIFFVEVHSCKNMSIVENTDKILDWCKKNNFKAFYLCEHKEIKDSSSIEGRGRYHLLLMHKNKKYPEGLCEIKQSDNINNININ